MEKYKISKMKRYGFLWDFHFPLIPFLSPISSALQFLMYFLNQLRGFHLPFLDHSCPCPKTPSSSVLLSAFFVHSCFPISNRLWGLVSKCAMCLMDYLKTVCKLAFHFWISPILLIKLELSVGNSLQFPYQIYKPATICTDLFFLSCHFYKWGDPFSF